MKIVFLVQLMYTSSRNSIEILDNEYTRAENWVSRVNFSPKDIIISHIYSQSIFAYILSCWQITHSLEHSRPCINIHSPWQRKKRKNSKSIGVAFKIWVVHAHPDRLNLETSPLFESFRPVSEKYSAEQ